MRFSTTTKILFAATFALAPMLHTASAQSTTTTRSLESMSIVAHARTETSTRLVVSYSVNRRALTMIGDRSNSSVTRIDVVEGSRLLLRASIDREGNGTITNHLGRTYSSSQLVANPALFGEFDLDALVALEPTIALYLATGKDGTHANPCGINPWVALGCAAIAGIGTGLGIFLATCEPYSHCTPNGCVYGFDCGD